MHGKPVNVSIHNHDSGNGHTACGHCHVSPCCCQGGLVFQGGLCKKARHSGHGGHVNNVHVHNHTTNVNYGVIENTDTGVVCDTTNVDHGHDHGHGCTCADTTACTCGCSQSNVTTINRETTVNINAEVNTPIGMNGCAPKVTDCTASAEPCGCTEVTSVVNVNSDTETTAETEDGTI